MSAPADGAPGARVVVGSRNPVKVDAVREVAAAWLPGATVEGADVHSGVPAQPWSDEEALRGAEARARGALRQGAELGVGVESGVARVAGRLYGFTWAVVRRADGATGRGCSARFEIPPAAARELERGVELEEAMLRATGIPRLGRGEGAMGLVTGGRVTRRDAACQALHFAMAAVVHAHLYRDPAGDPPIAR